MLLSLGAFAVPALASSAARPEAAAGAHTAQDNTAVASVDDARGLIAAHPGGSPPLFFSDRSTDALGLHVNQVLLPGSDYLGALVYQGFDGSSPIGGVSIQRDPESTPFGSAVDCAGHSVEGREHLGMFDAVYEACDVVFSYQFKWNGSLYTVASKYYGGLTKAMLGKLVAGLTPVTPAPGGCQQDLLFVGARGTDEGKNSGTTGFGATVQAALDPVAAKFGFSHRLIEDPLDYAYPGVHISDLAHFNWNAYQSGIHAGSAAVIQAIADQLARLREQHCADRLHVLLAGFSAGAWVIGDAFLELPKGIRYQFVDGIALFGDPRNHGNLLWHGLYDTGHPWQDGIHGPIDNSCLLLDPVCHADGATTLARGVSCLLRHFPCAHYTYSEPGGAATQAGRWLVNRVTAQSNRSPERVFINCLPGGGGLSPAFFQPQEHPQNCDLQGQPEDLANLLPLQGMHWTDWGRSETSGVGAARSTHPGQGGPSSYPVHVRLSGIQRGCHGQLYYTRAASSPGPPLALDILSSCTSIPQPLP